MKIDDAIKMLQEAKENGSKNVIFAFWTSDVFTKVNDKGLTKQFTENKVWENIVDFIDKNMDWSYTHEALQEIINQIRVKQ